MYKRLLVIFVTLALMFALGISFADDGTISFNEKNSTVSVKLIDSDYSQYKVLVQKSNSKYFYNLYKENEVFPLQMGSGTYQVAIYKHVSGKKYRPINSTSQVVNLGENDVYLQSVQNINWEDTMRAIKLAKELSLDKAKTEEQFKAIYDEIVKTIVYDDFKAQIVSQDVRYLPVIDETLDKRSGICYDYSSLMASMLRSLNIPTKMVHGKSSNTGDVYHAWNEVLLNGKWIVVDSTVDAGLFGANMNYNFDKPVQDYKGTKNF